MLENDLKIRTKFINKLITKIEDLNDNFILLSKVDKKILKKMNNQIGGDIGNNTILSVLKKSHEINIQQDKLKQNLKKSENINNVINSFDTTFMNIKNMIDKIEFENISSFNFDKYNDLSFNNLNEDNIEFLENLLSNKKKYRLLKDFKADETIAKDIRDKIDQTSFDILFPSRAVIDPMNTKIKERVNRALAVNRATNSKPIDLVQAAKAAKAAKPDNLPDNLPDTDSEDEVEDE
jgi:hypothetical protein